MYSQMLVQIDSVIESFAATICLQRQQTASVIAFGFPFAYCIKPKHSQTGDFVFFFAISSSVIAFAENVLSEQNLASLQKQHHPCCSLFRKWEDLRRL